MPPSQTAVIPFSVGKKLIKRHLELEHQAKWDACIGYRLSKILMGYLLPSTANEYLAMSSLRLRAAVGLLTGHTSLRAHLYKLGHAERQECLLCGDNKEDSVQIVCLYRISMQKIQDLGLYAFEA